MNERILIVDDEPAMALAMSQTLSRKGYAVDTAATGSEALGALGSRWYPVVLTDLRMPGMDGRELLQRVRTLSPRTQVVMVTAFATVASAVECVRSGAVDYLTKPFSQDSLLQAAASAMRAARAVSDDHRGTLDLVAWDPASLQTVELARRAARSDVTVLLEAESGAGKEVFARLIHRESPRSGGPFVAVNCAALPRELLEAELFGHTRGAFTGAHRDRKGHFQKAAGGTLLLDEIGEMDPDLQARLLRVLQDRTVQPIGAENAIETDARVIAATNCDLPRAVAEGRFREDLFYRLSVMPIRIPALRDRPGDIEPLAEKFARQYGGPDQQLTSRARARLRGHRWPGNVRELENAVQRAVILSGGQPIASDHLALGPFPGPGRSQAQATGLSLEEAERDAIRRVLEQTGGNRTAAAAALGISPRTLRHKLKRFRDEGRPVPEPAR